MTQTDDKIVNIEQNGFVPTGIANPANSQYGRGLLKPNRKNFGPRFGFAYQPSFAKDMVVRPGMASTILPKSPTRSLRWWKELRRRRVLR